MLKIFLILAVFDGGQWTQLQQVEVPTIQECVQKSEQFLTVGRPHLDDNVPAIASHCFIVREPAEEQK